ncbi:MAG: TonB-dependent receptor, partial [Bacteroidota bacterium]|nr:TonB-dependent receptor [Bacteroidota bacterium]
PTQNPNPDLRWERTAMANFGLDFSFLGGRLSGSVDYYDKNTSDLIWNYPVSTTQYFVNTLIANVGEMNNKGVELQLNAVPVDNGKFSWRTSFNLAHNKNVIKTLSNEKFSLSEIKTAVLGGQGQSGNTSQIIREGTPLGTFNIWHYMGKNEQGVSQFLKADGTITTTPSSLDFRVAGDAQPNLLYGWNNSFKYGNFDLNFFLRGVTGNKILNATLANMNNPTAAQIRNIPKFTLGESAGDYNAYLISDRFLENGSYLRLDNATLGYTFASAKNNFKNLRVYVTGTNLFTITDYTGIDPEISLGGLEPGIDNRNFYPKTRSFLLGVNVSF